MPKIKLYTRLLPYHQLGEAELTIDEIVYDVSSQSFQDMLTIYEPEMRTAEKVVLHSSEVGTWKYQNRRWSKEGC